METQGIENLFATEELSCKGKACAIAVAFEKAIEGIKLNIICKAYVDTPLYTNTTISTS